MANTLDPIELKQIIHSAIGRILGVHRLTVSKFVTLHDILIHT